MFSSISLPGSQWHSTRNDYSRRTHSVTYCFGLPHSAGVIRWKPTKCHGFHDTGHLYQECPMRRDCRRRRPYPPLHLRQMQRRGGREIHCRPMRKKMGWHGTADSQSLWGTLCFTPARQEIWPIWRKCADRRKNAGCEARYWTPVHPGTTGPGARVKCDSPSGEQRGGSGGKKGGYSAPITNRIISGDKRSHRQTWRYREVGQAR
jgi:hypothetical protein